jgi:hypothetical protein
MATVRALHVAARIGDNRGVHLVFRITIWADQAHFETIRPQDTTTHLCCCSNDIHLIQVFVVDLATAPIETAASLGEYLA